MVSQTDQRPRSMSGIGFRVHAWCKSCRHAKDADLAALVVAGRGDVPLVQRKWRCGNYGSRLTEFIIVGFHMQPR
jgi:hypothetical protein